MKKLNPLIYIVGLGFLVSAVSAFAKNNGLAAKNKITEKDVDPKELAIGIKIEMEHTSSAEKAKQIALDHLTENPKYYSILQSVGL
jgi:hypothetical protein